MAKKQDFTVTNIVVAGNLGFELDLYKILYTLEEQGVNIEYEPEQFPGAIIKLDKPKATILVFKNGKVVVVGAREKKNIEEALRKVYDLLKPLAKRIIKKVNRNKIPYKVTNIVAAGDVGMKFDLFEVAIGLEGVDVEYEPEQFPGAIIKLPHLNVTVLLFKNGKVILAGAAEREKLEQALKEVKRMLKPFAREKS